MAYGNNLHIFAWEVGPSSLKKYQDFLGEISMSISRFYLKEKKKEKPLGVFFSFSFCINNEIFIYISTTGK